MPTGNFYWTRLAAGLHLSGANGATSFPDAKGHSFYRTGAVAVSTAQSRFSGEGSTYFPGGTNDLLKCDAHADFGAYAPSMAIAFSMFPTAYPVGQSIRVMMIGANASYGSCFIALNTDVSIYFGIAAGGTAAVGSAGGAFALNTWSDVLFTMFNRTGVIYVNGAVVAYSNNLDPPAGTFPKRVQIGGDNSGYSSADGRFQGYLSEVQIGLSDGMVPGIWPPTAPFAEFHGVPLAKPSPRNGPVLQMPFQVSRARRQSVATVAQDVVNTGRGRVYGTTKNTGSPDYPVARRVRLARKRDGILIRETWSDAAGNYVFEHVRHDIQYVVTSHDHTGLYNAVVADSVIPELMV